MKDFVEVTTDNYQQHFEKIMEIESISFPTPWSINNFFQEVKNPISHFIAIIFNRSLSGYMCFWMFDSEIQLINIAVHPESRSCGLGSALMIKMIEEGKTGGLQNIWLEVRESNLAAKGLYEKLGFKPIGLRPRYYRDRNGDAIVMGLRLSVKEFRRMACS